MMTFIHPRLRRPLGVALAGTVFAAAWALRGGDAWQLSVAAEVTVLVSAITTYVRAGEDSDDGALAGSRADERQKMLRLRSRALGWNFAMARPCDSTIVRIVSGATFTPSISCRCSLVLAMPISICSTTRRPSGGIRWRSSSSPTRSMCES